MAKPGRSKTLSNGLTPKQDRFAKEIIKQIEAGENPNATAAAMTAYDVKDRSVANAIGSENLAKPSIQEELESALSVNGLSTESVMANLQRLANAVPEKHTDATILKTNLAILDLLGHGKSSKKGKITWTVKQKVQGLSYDEAKQRVTQMSSITTEFITDADG